MIILIVNISFCFINVAIYFVHLYNNFRIIFSEKYFFADINFINTLKVFWPIFGQRKTSILIFFEKIEGVQLFFFGHNIIFNDVYQAIRHNIGQKDN